MTKKPTPSGSQSASPSADAALPALGENHYHDAMRDLHEEALARNELEAFVDAATGALAWIIFHVDRPDVTADVLVRLGRHLEQYAGQPANDPNGGGKIG
jgi:hypothetical protein